MPAETIVAAARMYAQGPSCFVSGHGIDAFSAGVQTFRAFHSLVAISGNVDRLGGNRRVKTPRGFRAYLDLLHMPQFRLPEEIERQTLGADRFPLWAGPRGWQTACHNPTVIDAILTSRPYPVRAMYISGVNIAVTYPDTRRTLEALRSLDFVAVATHEMTPTAAMADIVLPKTTALEEEEVSFAPAGPAVLYTRNAVPPSGEARCDLDIAVGLLDRLAARGAVAKNLIPWRSQREFNEFILGDSGISLAELQRTGCVPVPYRLGNFDEQPFATPSRKIELLSETMRAAGLDPLPDYTPPARERAGDDVRAAYPLILLTGDREKTYHHSRFRGEAWARKVSPDPTLLIHPDTARRLGIGDGTGSRSRRRPARRRAACARRSADATAPDVVSTGMGWWRPDAPGPEHGALDVNINAALSYAGPFDPVSGSPDARGLLCRVQRVVARIERSGIRSGRPAFRCAQCGLRTAPSRRHFALEHQPIEVAPLVHVVVGIGLVHDAAVVPQHPVAMAPLVAVLVFLLRRVRHQLGDQRQRVGVLHAHDRFDAHRIEKQRLAAVLRMGAHQRVDAGRRHLAHALLADRAERPRAVLAQIHVHRLEPVDLAPWSSAGRSS